MQSRRNLPLAFLLVAVFLTYSNSFGNSFHFDDFHTITDNPAVRSLGNLPRIFTDTTAFSVLPANQTYRPIVTASLALDYALGHGYVPFWFHLSTMLWFLALVAVIFVWAETLFERTLPGGENRWWALGVAGWFGLHPAMAETVNYVIQRGDLYATLGCLAGLLLFAQLRGWRRYIFPLVPFALAMLSKPTAAVFPLLLLFYVFFFEAEGLSAPQRWRASFLAALPSMVATLLLLRLQSAMTPKSYAPTILSAAQYRLTQPYVWLRYFRTLFLPLHLNVDTDLQAFTRWNGPALLGVGFVAALLALVVLCGRRRRLYPIAYGLLWFVLTQLPTSIYALSEVENDHRMFFSFPGLMLAVVWALRLAFERLRGAVPVGRRKLLYQGFAGLCGLLLCGYAFGAFRRNAIWHDEASLWADDVAKAPHNGRGLMIYGLTRMNAGDYPGALGLFQQALLYTPNYPTLEVNLGIVNGLMAATGQIGRTAVAERHFLRAVSLAPGDDLPHAYYGRWLLTQGRLPDATAQLQIAVSLNGQREMQRDLLLKAYGQVGNTVAARALAESTLALIPNDAEALAVTHGGSSGGVREQANTHIDASLAAYRAGRYEASIAEAREALQADPQSAEAWNNVGAGYGALHQWDEGIAAEKEALRLNPALTIATNNLHWFQSQKGVAQGTRPAESATDYVNRSLALSLAGKHAESIEAARKALQLDPNSAEAWNNIAAGDEALGRWDEAIDAARHALALRPDFQLAKNNLVWSLQHRGTAVSGR